MTPGRTDVPRRGPPAGGEGPPASVSPASSCAPRPEAVDAGYAKIMGFEAIWAEMGAHAGTGRPSREHPYGTGDAARKIVDALEDYLGRQPPFS